MISHDSGRRRARSVCETSDAATSAVASLRTMVNVRTPHEGRTDSMYPGLRYYRFSAPIEYKKTQLLSPGIVVVLQGGKTVTLGNSSHSYNEMNYLVLGGEAVCQGTVVTASAGSPYLAIHLDLPPAALVKTFIALAGMRQASHHSRVEENFVSPVDTDVLCAFERLLPATDTPVDCATIAPLIVEEIVVRLIRSEAAGAIRDAAAITRSATRIQQSMHFIQANFRSPLTVNDLASQASMSASHFAHSFRQVSGVSPMRYLRNVRLDEARALLVAKRFRSSEVAAQVGFESGAHFNREFRRRFDASPTEYVRRMSAAGQDMSAETINEAINDVAAIDIASHRGRT